MRILQIDASSGRVPRSPVLLGRGVRERLVGDNWNDKGHHGLPGPACLLLSSETNDLLEDEGFPFFPGALGENVATQGLDSRSVRPGQVYRIGTEVLLRITKPRTPYRTISVHGAGIERALSDEGVPAGSTDPPRCGRSGFSAEVLQEGTVCPDDETVRIPEAAFPRPRHTTRVLR